ncbi:pilin [Patescibacteria group bacterium]
MAITTLVLSVNIVMNEQVNAKFDGYLEIIEGATELPTYDTLTHGDAIKKQGVSNITTAIYFTLDFFKFLIASIAVIMIIITGGRLILARKKIDEVMPKMKEQMIMLATGVVMIIVADVLVKNVFFGLEGEVYDSEATAQIAATEGTRQIKGFYNIAMLVAGALAIFMMVVAGFRLLVSAGNEEAQTKVKKQITWLVVGLFIIGLAEFVVQDFLFPDKGSKIPEARQGILMIVRFTNFTSAFISISAFIASMYGGFLYVTATGNEEKTQNAKKVLIGAVIAMVLGLGAFALVNTVIQLEPGT